MEKEIINYSGEQLRGAIDILKAQLHYGLMSYDEAKEKAQPVIDEINRRGLLIAKKYGKKYQKQNFINLMR